MNAEAIRFRLEANALAACLSLVGLAVAARIGLELLWRSIDRATTSGGAR